MDEQWLREMDVQRYRDPEATVAELRAAEGELPPELNACYLGVLGSAHRQLSWVDGSDIERNMALAGECIELGLWLARRSGRGNVVGDLLQRLSYVLRDRGDLEQAVRAASESTSVFLEQGDIDRIGRTFHERGMYLYYLGRPEQADIAHKTSIEYLDRGSLHSLVAAYQARSLCQNTLSNYAEADKWRRLAREALAQIDCGARSVVLLSWLDGILERDRGDYDRSTRTLTEVARRASNLGLGDALLAICDLAQVHLLKGHSKEARRVIEQLRPLVMQFPEDSVAATAIVTLLRVSSKALSPRLVQAVERQLMSNGYLKAQPKGAPTFPGARWISKPHGFRKPRRSSQRLRNASRTKPATSTASVPSRP